MLSLALIVAAVLMIIPAFFMGAWVGLLLVLVPLFAAVAMVLKPRR